jgi:hypothetical protein
LQRFAGVHGTTAGDTALAARLVTNNKFSITPTGKRTNIRESATPIATGVPQVVAGAVSGLTSVSATDNPIIQFGVADLACLVNVAPSGVLYRVYLEDFTVSGRTYSEVEAADLAEFATAFGVGGRYAGDTHTAVSALP